MDEKYISIREQFFTAIRALATSADPIQTRLISAMGSLLEVTIDEFEGDRELKIKFARILDLLAIDADDMETVAEETAAHMTDFEAEKIADLICDFYCELRGNHKNPEN
ncbi:hypothetical protein [Mesorhizobium sp. 10J20-29]